MLPYPISPFTSFFSVRDSTNKVKHLRKASADHINVNHVTTRNTNSKYTGNNQTFSSVCKCCHDYIVWGVLCLTHVFVLSFIALLGFIAKLGFGFPVHVGLSQRKLTLQLWCKIVHKSPDGVYLFTQRTALVHMLVCHCKCSIIHFSVNVQMKYFRFLGVLVQCVHRVSRPSWPLLTVKSKTMIHAFT